MGDDVRVGMALAATAALACAVAAAQVRADPLFVLTGLPALPRALLWMALLRVVLARSAQVLSRAVAQDTCWLRVLGAAAGTLVAAAVPSAVWALLPDVRAPITLLDGVELYFAPLSIVWAPALTLLATRRLRRREQHGLGPAVQHLLVACGLLASSVLLYGWMRTTGAGSHERVLVTLVVSLLAVPFLGAGLLSRPPSS